MYLVMKHIMLATSINIQRGKYYSEYTLISIRIDDVYETIL